MQEDLLKRKTTKKTKKKKDRSNEIDRSINMKTLKISINKKKKRITTQDYSPNHNKDIILKKSRNTSTRHLF